MRVRVNPDADWRFSLGERVKVINSPWPSGLATVVGREAGDTGWRPGGTRRIGRCYRIRVDGYDYRRDDGNWDNWHSVDESALKKLDEIADDRVKIKVEYVLEARMREDPTGWWTRIMNLQLDTQKAAVDERDRRARMYAGSEYRVRRLTKVSAEVSEEVEE